MHNELNILYNLILKDIPQKTDVVVWLQGDRYDRAKNIIKMYNLGLADKIIISGNNVLVGPKTRISENNISLTEMKNHLLNNKVDNDSIIIDDKAFNTKEQAIHIASLAKKYRWESITLVGSAYGQPRTFLTFLKQFKLANVNARIYNYPAVIDPENFPGGRNASIDKLKVLEATKISKYAEDLSSITEGIKYLENRK
jgi:uncharacterized SAM-binding protein YcdF (DUF218 family)